MLVRPSFRGCKLQKGKDRGGEEFRSLGGQAVFPGKLAFRVSLPIPNWITQPSLVALPLNVPSQHQHRGTLNHRRKEVYRSSSRCSTSICRNVAHPRDTAVAAVGWPWQDPRDIGPAPFLHDPSLARVRLIRCQTPNAPPGLLEPV